MHVPAANEAGPSPQSSPSSAFPSDSAPSSSPLRGSEYAMLSRQIRQARLLDRRLRYYAAKIAVTAAALAAGWAAFALIGDSWWQLGIAVFLAVMFGQLGFLGHDAGHQQIFRSRKANYLLGVACGNLGIGLSFGWWTGKHNRHTPPQHRGRRPRHHDRCPGVLRRPGAGGPGGAAAGLPLSGVPVVPHDVPGGGQPARRQPSFGDAPDPRAPGRPARGVGGSAAHTACRRLPHCGLPRAVARPGRAVILVQQGLFGFYLACSFAPNHKGMPLLEAGDRTDFLRRQVLTSRNVRGGWLTDAALGGLNYQIEHHLFPSMPRPSLRRAQPLVAAFCADRGLPYCQTSLLGSTSGAAPPELGRQAHRPRRRDRNRPPGKMPPSDRHRVAAAAAPGEPLTSSPP